ncbi:MAG: phage portal protein [Planctomycetota bacterium]|jgi:capsid protein
MNRAHWSLTSDQTINEKLLEHLPTLRRRAVYEIEHNPRLLGVANSWINDVVGESGPTLKVKSSSKKFSETLEQGWAGWWKRPDLRQRMSGADMLRLWGRSLWSYGEYIVRFATTSKESPIALRLHNISPLHLVDPFGTGISTDRVFMGIQIDEEGVPDRYFFSSEILTGIPSTTGGFQATSIGAEFIEHRFFTLEPDQFRGLPICSTPLQTAADLADLDEETQDAIRAAAQIGIVIAQEGDSGGNPAVGSTEKQQFERGTTMYVQGGQSVSQVESKQPNASYGEFMKGRVGDLGASVVMPVLRILRSAADSNLASAKLDMTTYNVALDATRVFLNQTLNRILAEFTKEMFLNRELTGRMPASGSIQTEWHWGPHPSPDPEKDSRAVDRQLANGSLSMTAEMARRGIRIEDHIAELQKEKELAEAAGVVLNPSQSQPQPEEDIEEPEEETEEETENDDEDGDGNQNQNGNGRFDTSPFVSSTNGGRGSLIH